MWLQASALLPIGYLQVAGSCAQDLGAMQAASVPCWATLRVTWSLIQAGLWGRFLHLIATIRRGCKGLGCSMAGFVRWGSSTSAFLPATLWSTRKRQLAPRWFR